MAWTNPRTWVSGEVVTAALMNTHLRDNLLEIAPTGGVWQAYTPGGSGISGATFTGRYVQIGKTVHFKARAVLNSGFALSTSIAMTLPVTANATLGSYSVVTGAFEDSGFLTYVAAMQLNSSHAIGYGLGSNGVYTNLTATYPFTWGVGDAITYSGTYEAA